MKIMQTEYIRTGKHIAAFFSSLCRYVLCDIIVITKERMRLMYKAYKFHLYPDENQNFAKKNILMNNYDISIEKIRRI